MKLGVNVDHIATLRNARGGFYPDPVAMARIAIEAGASFITAHLREDRRHIQEDDLRRLKQEGFLLNMEMAPREEMFILAREFKPHMCCLVPENRQELTTEGGLDLTKFDKECRKNIDRLREQHIMVSVFIEPDPLQIEIAQGIGVHAIELHTGWFCHNYQNKGSNHEQTLSILNNLKEAAFQAHNKGLCVHAGHGLDNETAYLMARLPHIDTLNIGYFLVARALEIGFATSISEMLSVFARATADGLL